MHRQRLFSVGFTQALWPIGSLISLLTGTSAHSLYLTLILVSGAASWSSGQSLWLLIMRSRVRFPVLPWEFSLKGKIPAVTIVWVG